MRWGILLFFSGAAALVYQVLCVKELSVAIGADAFALTLGVAFFLSGLALGSVVFGRRADTSMNCVMLYAALEVGIAALGTLAMLTLGRIAPTFAALEASIGPPAWLLPALLMGLPAFLMGGTVPVLVRARKPDDESLGRSAGRLFAAHRAGGVVGVLVAVLVLIPMVGARGAGLIAAAVNLGLGLAAVMIARHRGAEPMRRAPAVPDRPANTRLALLLVALAGGLAFGYECLWSEAVATLASAHAFGTATVLATVLLGTAVGAWLGASRVDRVDHPWTMFGMLVASAGSTALLILVLFGGWATDLQAGLGTWALETSQSQVTAMCVRFAVTSVLLVLPPAVIVGAVFPTAVRLVARAPRVGADVGSILGWTLVGGVGGTLLTKLALLPALGLPKALGALAIVASLAGVAAMLHGGRRSPRLVGWALGLVVVAVGLTLVVPGDKVGRLLAHTKGGRLVAYDETADGSVAVMERVDGLRAFRRLYVDGAMVDDDGVPTQRARRLNALIPILVHSGAPRSALLIGYGAGTASGAALAYPLERVTCVERVPGVVGAAEWFPSSLAPPDPRLGVEFRDARRHLLEMDAKVDVISVAPPPPSARGAVNLYSVEFYELARDRLAPKGVLAQAWPLATQSDDDSRALVKSFVEVFPYVALWTTEVHHMTVLGSMQPIELDGDRIAERYALPEVGRVLTEVGVASTAEFLATYMMGERGLTSYVAGAHAITDDRPRVEFEGFAPPDELSRVLPRLIDLAEVTPIEGTGQLLRDRVQAKREELFDLCRATIAASIGDTEGWHGALERVLSRDPDDPYFQWFAGVER